jgi:hypothetical protein
VMRRSFPFTDFAEVESRLLLNGVL